MIYAVVIDALLKEDFLLCTNLHMEICLIAFLRKSLQCTLFDEQIIIRRQVNHSLLAKKMNWLSFFSEYFCIYCVYC